MKDVNPRDLVIPEDRNLDIDMFPELIAGKCNSYIMERRYCRKNGEIFWACINYSLFRDLDVLRLMIDGLNNAEIAERLVVSFSTVKYHISNILMKLGVENRVAAVTTAMQKKLV